MSVVIIGTGIVSETRVTLSQQAPQNPPLGGVVPMPTLADLGGAPLLPSVSAELLVDFAAPGVVPVYTTLFSLQLTTTQPSSLLWFVFTSTWIHTGPFAGNVAVNFRFRLNGALLVGGSTDNRLRSQIGSVSRNGRQPVTPATNPQTLNVEVSHFSGPANIVRIEPGTRPDLCHAALFMEEQL